jgi:hypothetical protein
MDFGKLFKRGKKVVDDRGGVESLKEDATELKDVATKKEGLGEKATDAAAAIKDPGAPGSAN